MIILKFIYSVFLKRLLGHYTYYDSLFARPLPGSGPAGEVNHFLKISRRWRLVIILANGLIAIIFATVSIQAIEWSLNYAGPTTGSFIEVAPYFIYPALYYSICWLLPSTIWMIRNFNSKDWSRAKIKKAEKKYKNYRLLGSFFFD